MFKAGKWSLTFLVTVDRDGGGLDVGHNVGLLNREGEAGWHCGNL